MVTGDTFPPGLIYQANGSNAKPMAPTCAESSDMRALVGWVGWVLVDGYGLNPNGGWVGGRCTQC